MPEEINRVMTDSISEWLFVSEPAGVMHLMAEGQLKSRIHLVGDLLADVLRAHEASARSAAVWRRWGLIAGQYGVVTLHRPANVDDAVSLGECIEILELISCEVPLLLPLHPRTKHAIEKFDLSERVKAITNLTICEPLDYLEFLSVLSESRVIVSDSGGVQLEATLLNVPCLTLRETTERPLTIEAGTNTLVARDKELIRSALTQIVIGDYKRSCIPDFWDGHASRRIAERLLCPR